jgi:type II secretory ATPase GspE/PulE/Tfp pilus assembly ATPase PilB-like protein
MAMEAAMTGHLVFSTIHTNSSAETITRVFNLGAKPFMVAGTFNLVMAQRLSKKICTTCRAQLNVKDTPHFHDAVDSFNTMEKEELKQEIIKRGITQQQWLDFVNNGVTYVGTGKDAQGNMCQMCHGSGYK